MPENSFEIIGENSRYAPRKRPPRLRLVLDVKVVAMPDRIHGEKGGAFLVMVRGARLLTVKELRDFLATEGLAKFKLPERVQSIEAFPVTQIGSSQWPERFSAAFPFSIV